MAKESPIGVRLDPDVKAAIERAAAADERPVSTMIAKIVGEWVRAGGWLKVAQSRRIAARRKES